MTVATVARYLPEELMQRLLEQSDACIKVLSLDGRMLAINQGGLRALEMDDFRPWRNTPWLDLWPDQHRVTAAATLHSAASGEAARFRGYCPTVKGTPKWWDVELAPVPGKEHTRGHLFAVSHEIGSAEKRAEISTFTTYLHEVRTALTIIVGETQLLERRIVSANLPDTPRWTRSARAILAAVDKLQEQLDVRLRRNQRDEPL